MRKVRVRIEDNPPPETGPIAAWNTHASGRVWQVLGSDPAHWRAGLYSPSLTSRSEVEELEQHTCPELFILMEGRVTLVLSDGTGGMREHPLEKGVPLFVNAPHSGFCPDGAHTGTVLVVERDHFETEYREPREWT